LGASDSNVCPAEENVEAICHFFNTIGKQLDESPKSRRINDMYFGRLKELSTNPQLAPRMKFMVRDVIDLRANNWVPRREEVNLKCSLFCIYTSCLKIQRLNLPVFLRLNCSFNPITFTKLRFWSPKKKNYKMAL